VVDAGNAVVDVGRAAVHGAENVAGQVTSSISDALSTTPNAIADIRINVGPTGLVSSDAVSRTGAFGHVAVYCVQCGVNGVLHLTGSARYTIKDGLQQTNAGLNGNLAISQNTNFALVSAAVPPGFSVPRVFAIGPVVNLDAGFRLEISLAGQIPCQPGQILVLKIHAAVSEGLSGSSCCLSECGLGISIPPLNFQKTAAVYQAECQCPGHIYWQHHRWWG